MLIYLAHPADPSGQQAISQAVRDRGLAFYRARPCDVHVTVIPDVIQPGYTSYSRNLPAYMEATLTNKVVQIRNRGYPITTVPYLLPMTIPPLIYDYQAKPSEAKITKLREHSVVTQGRGKTISFVMQSPTLELIQAVASQYANRTTPHVFGTVNLTGMKCVFVIQKILSAFLLTHTYPAFRHISDMNPVKLPKETSNKRRKTSTSTYFQCVSKPDEHLKESKDDEKEAEEENEEEDAPMAEAFDPTTMIRLVNAKPSTISGEKWGSSNDIPNTSGVFVPFVGELAVEDDLTITSLVATYFLKSLASTPEGMVAKMAEIRSGWSMVSSTRLGHEWSHLGRCIDIALQAQCFVYPVYTNNVYEGTMICGAGYRIAIKDRIFSPVAYAEIQGVVQDNTMHQKSLTEIVRLAGEQEDEIRTCENIRALSTLLLSIRMDEVTKQEVVKNAMKLNYSNKYWSTSAANVQQALSLIMSTEDIPDDVPMFPRYMFSTKRDEQILSAFGHMAPTFMIPNGRKCEMGVMEQPPKNLTIRTVSVDTAILDLKYIRENGYITNNMSNLSSRHKDVPVKSDFKKEIWRSLRALAQVGDNTTSAEVVDSLVSGTSVGRAVDDGLW